MIGPRRFPTSKSRGQPEIIRSSWDSRILHETTSIQLLGIPPVMVSPGNSETWRSKNGTSGRSWRALKNVFFCGYFLRGEFELDQHGINVTRYHGISCKGWFVGLFVGNSTRSPKPCGFRWSSRSFGYDHGWFSSMSLDRFTGKFAGKPHMFPVKIFPTKPIHLLCGTLWNPHCQIQLPEGIVFPFCFHVTTRNLADLKECESMWISLVLASCKV